VFFRTEIGTVFKAHAPSLQSEQRRARKLTIDLVLATDVSKQLRKRDFYGKLAMYAHE
jgi:hypothetical protein